MCSGALAGVTRLSVQTPGFPHAPLGRGGVQPQRAGKVRVFSKSHSPTPPLASVPRGDGPSGPVLKRSRKSRFPRWAARILRAGSPSRRPGPPRAGGSAGCTALLPRAPALHCPGGHSGFPERWLWNVSPPAKSHEDTCEFKRQTLLSVRHEMLLGIPQRGKQDSVPVRTASVFAGGCAVTLPGGRPDLSPPCHRRRELLRAPREAGGRAAGRGQAGAAAAGAVQQHPEAGRRAQASLGGAGRSQASAAPGSRSRSRSEGAGSAESGSSRAGAELPAAPGRVAPTWPLAGHEREQQRRLRTAVTKDEGRLA